MSEAAVNLTAGMQVTPTVHLVRPLGAGGMGAVWLADHTGLKTRVVVKFMLGDLGQSSSARARFSREAAAAAQVKSPHVVQMFDHGVTDDGTPFIVMEYLEGRDLGALITDRGSLDPATVVTIIAQVAKALSKVHAAGLLHRDIKPDNIFLVEGEEDVFAKLLDFGIAKSHTASTSGEDVSTLDGQTKTGQIVGTPFYMSPEQVTAQKSIDLRSDLWALGVVAYEALTGKKPFDGPSFGALAVLIATGTIPRPTEANATLPPSLDAWFAKACAREPSARFASARELAEGLRAAFDGVVSLPVISGMSDSGPRAPSASGPRFSTPAHGSGSMPVSVGTEAGARPSFVLASTAAVASSNLSGSQGGAAVEAGAAPRRGPPLGAIIGIVVVLACVGIGAFVVGRKSNTDQPHAIPTRSAAATLPSVAPVASSVAIASPIVESSVAVDAGAAHPPASAPHASTLGNVGHGRPPASGKPATSGDAPRPPRPVGSNDDILY